MREQIPLHFNTPQEFSYELMSLEELQKAYLAHVGYPSRPHDNERGIILNALNNDPKLEVERLREIDIEEDKEEMNRLYRR